MTSQRRILLVTRSSLPVPHLLHGLLRAPNPLPLTTVNVNRMSQIIHSVTQPVNLGLDVQVPPLFRIGVVGGVLRILRLGSGRGR